MIDIVTLGPAGTFSQLAADRMRSLPSQKRLSFYPTLTKTLNAVGEAAEIGVVPIENILEGVVSPVVDAFVKRPLQIIDEVTVPIAFSLIANQPNPQQVFAQFVAQGQCSDALERLAVPLTTTASNSESLKQLLACETPAAALVPSHLVDTELRQRLAWVEDEASDSPDNATRFIAVTSAAQKASPNNAKTRYKTSFLILDDADQPGLLVEHLQVLAAYKVNLMALVSRPTGRQFGQYHFYLECEGRLEDSALQAALTLIRLRTQVVTLGSYPDRR